MIKDFSVSSVTNSKNQKSIKIVLKTDNGKFSASVPSGTSVGRHETKEYSVDIEKIIAEKIKKNFIGLDERNMDSVLEKIGGSLFEKIGGDFALAMSIASARSKTPDLWKLGKQNRFPIQISNIVGGGKHGGETDFQEFLLFPASAKSPHDAYIQLLSAYSSVGKSLKKKKLVTGKNIEKAWTSKLDDLKTLDMLSDFNLNLGVDCASSSLWNRKSKNYVYKKSKKILSTGEHLEFLLDLIKTYKISYLEDPFHEDDFDSFSELTKKIGSRCLIIGDDLYCTNSLRLMEGVKKKSTNGIIIKPNQVGTLSKTEETVKVANANKMLTVGSHRSGETKDDWLADIGVAFGLDMIKIGLKGYDLLKIQRLDYIWNSMKSKYMASIKYSKN